MNTFKEILETIKSYDTIIIKRHLFPDGDCIGSGLGLTEILKASFPSKRILFDSPNDSKFLEFLNEGDEVTEDDHKGALVITVDTSVSKRVCNWSDKGDKIIKIDHHIVEEEFGDLNYVEEESPACALIIFKFYEAFKDVLKITPKAVKALFVGIYTDTGGFRYGNPDGEFFVSVGKLLKAAPINLTSVYRDLEKVELNSVRIKGYVASHFKIYDKVAYFYISQRTMNKFKVSPEEARNTVSVMSGIKDVEAWLFFCDVKDKIMIRFRSKNTDVAAVANLFNGGGHRLASGGTIYKKSDIMKVVKKTNEAVWRMLNENSHN